jgi:hypothetical protein
MDGPAFDAVRSYVRDVFAGRYSRASAGLDQAIAAEGLGAINGALGDAGRSLLDEIRYPSGTIDVLAEIERLATRVVDIALHTPDERERADELERQKALVVFLGSEGLPCAARTTVASWTPLDRLKALSRTVIGLTAVVAERTGRTALGIADELTPPGEAGVALGTFGLAWRDEHGRPSVLAGALPRGQTAHITFLGTGTTSLRSVFARVARGGHLGASGPGLQQRVGGGDRGQQRQ